MPIYEYECPKCGTIEVMQKISDAPLTECDRCRSPVHRIVSHSSFQLKGGGWYKDLYSSTPKSSPSSSSN